MVGGKSACLVIEIAHQEGMDSDSETTPPRDNTAGSAALQVRKIGQDRHSMVIDPPSPVSKLGRRP